MDDQNNFHAKMKIWDLDQCNIARLESTSFIRFLKILEEIHKAENLILEEITMDVYAKERGIFKFHHEFPPKF